MTTDEVERIAELEATVERLGRELREANEARDRAMLGVVEAVNDAVAANERADAALVDARRMRETAAADLAMSRSMTDRMRAALDAFYNELP